MALEPFSLKFNDKLSYCIRASGETQRREDFLILTQGKSKYQYVIIRTYRCVLFKENISIDAHFMYLHIFT